MKVYRGTRRGDTVLVTVDGIALDPRLDLTHCGSSVFEWGYVGDGPARLALALLVDCLGDEEAALAGHEDYHCAVVAGLPFAAWKLTDEDIRDTIVAMDNQ